MKLGALAAVMSLALVACGTTNNNTGNTQAPPPTARSTCSAFSCAFSANVCPVSGGSSPG